MALRRERMRLGDLLIRQDVLTEEKLKKALELQKGTGKKIGEVLVENGFITEEMIARALQTQLGLKMIELTGVTIPKEVRNLVSVNLLKKYQCIPFELDPYNANILHLAMSDPMDMAAIDDISIVTNHTLRHRVTYWRQSTAAMVRPKTWMLRDDLHVNESSFVEMWKRQQRPMSVMPRSYSWYVP